MFPSVSPLKPSAARRTLRLPLPARIISAQCSNPRFLGYVADLSETGAFIQSSNPKPVGTYLCLLLDLPEAPGREVACSGEIIWTRGYSGKHGPCQGMGVRFIEIPEEVQRFLRRFCATQDPVEAATCPQLPAPTITRPLSPADKPLD